MKKDIILCGVGGQGILSIATIIGEAATKAGLYLKQAEVHGMSQRGGDVQSNLRLSTEPIWSDLIAEAGADLIISMEPMEAMRYLAYLSKDGKSIDSLLKRSELYAGQAPESFDFRTYLNIHNSVTDEEIAATAGSSEIAYRHGMKIRLVEGSERNFKITTIEDLETFETIINS